MDSDHSESEFYYPDEVEKFSDKEISVRNGKKTNRRLSLRWRVCKKITVKKTEYDLHV